MVPARFRVVPVRFRAVPGSSGLLRHVPVGSGWVPRFRYTPIERLWVGGFRVLHSPWGCM